MRSDLFEGVDVERPIRRRGCRATIVTVEYTSESKGLSGGTSPEFPESVADVGRASGPGDGCHC